MALTRPALSVNSSPKLGFRRTRFGLMKTTLPRVSLPMILGNFVIGLSTLSCGLWSFRTWSNGRSFLWSTFRLSTSWRICSLNRLPRLHSLVSCLCSLGTLALITPGTLPDRLLAVGASYGPEASCPSAPAFFRFLLSAIQSLSSTSFGTVGGCSSRSPCCELYIAPGRAGPVSRAIYPKDPSLWGTGGVTWGGRWGCPLLSL